MSDAAATGQNDADSGVETSRKISALKTGMFRCN